MWQAFVTGFAEKATSLIEERNKEIRDEIFMQMNQRAKENEKVKEKAQLRMEKMRETARDLQSILGNKFGEQTESIVAELLLSGDPDTIIKQVRAGEIGVDQIGNFVKLDKAAKPRTVEEVITGMAPRAKAAAPRVAGEETTAFGLPTRVGEQTRKSFMARTGMTEAESAGLELPEVPRPTAKFDYDVLRPAAKDSLAGRIDKYSRAVLDADTDEERQAAQTELNRALRVKAMQEKKEGTGGDKESDIRSNFRILDGTIKSSMAGPGDLVVDRETGSYLYSRSINPDIRAKIERARVEGFRDLANSYANADGSFSQEAVRVMKAFGIKFDKNNRPMWDAGAAQKPAPADAEPVATPAAPSAAKAKPAAISESVKASALPIPRTPEGEIDVAKLQAGKVYRTKDGTSYRIWNGQGWQPVSPQ